MTIFEGAMYSAPSKSLWKLGSETQDIKSAGLKTLPHCPVILAMVILPITETGYSSSANESRPAYNLGQKCMPNFVSLMKEPLHVTRRQREPEGGFMAA